MQADRNTSLEVSIIYNSKCPDYAIWNNNKHSIWIDIFLDNSAPTADLQNCNKTYSYTECIHNTSLHILHVWQNIEAIIINHTYRLRLREASWSKQTGHWAIFQRQPVYESCIEFAGFGVVIFSEMRGTQLKFGIILLGYCSKDEF